MGPQFPALLGKADLLNASYQVSKSIWVRAREGVRHRAQKRLRREAINVDHANTQVFSVATHSASAFVCHDGTIENGSFWGSVILDLVGPALTGTV
jgi:hypothetical protein